MPPVTRSQARRARERLTLLYQLYQQNKDEILRKQRQLQQQKVWTEKRKQMLEKHQEENKCVICFEYHMTEPHKLEHLSFATICRHLGSLRNLRYRSHPMKMFCCRQHIHDRCLYAFLATQYGYKHHHQRQEWQCPLCRTSLILAASRHFPPTVNAPPPAARDHVRRELFPN